MGSWRVLVAIEMRQAVVSIMLTAVSGALSGFIRACDAGGFMMMGGGGVGGRCMNRSEAGGDVHGRML